MKTHKFNLISGPECEVKEMTGKHQRLLTEQKTKKIGDNLNEVLADIVVRIGTRTDFTIDFFAHELLAADKKKILGEARQFTMDFEKDFTFQFEYINSENVDSKYEQVVDLSGGFPETPFKRLEKVNVAAEGETPVFEEQWVPWTVNEYKDIKPEYDVKLPKEGRTVRLALLNGKGEVQGANTKKNERSSHTPIAMRFPRYVDESSDKKELLRQVNLDKLSYKDIEYIRKMIKLHEGQLDTELKFEHPEAENKDSTEKYVVVDLMSQLAFFFPSEAI